MSGRNRSILIGESSVFVSHAHSSVFADLVDAVRNYCSKNRLSLQATYFFIDVFCASKRETKLCASEEAANGEQAHILQLLLKAIAVPGRMIIHIEPWSDPKVLTRTWCLYEMYLASISHAKVEMIASKDDETKMRNALAEDLHLAAKLSEHLDVEKTATNEKKDQRMIHAAINGDIGIEVFNDVVRTKFRRSLTEATLSLVLIRNESKVKRTLRKHGRRTLVELPLLAV